ncbi:hypothetical protein [Faecalibaculum rodentium]|uniref:hypothetical protein n=1 Tax=Faecalibaculum rodentium TaxID=1702221 RepID=UPI0026354061|nr:hypothetical protein [Faecalibaculum rodentium]
MTNTEKLNEKIKNLGLKKIWICKQLGLSKEGFRKKAENITEFTPSEIKKMCQILGIKSLREKEAIFFAGEIPE